MNRRQTLYKSFVSPGSDTSLAFYPPAQERELTDAEQNLGSRIPQDLRNLLAETNGVELQLRFAAASEDLLIGYVIWPLERIVRENAVFRTNPQITNYYRPVDNYLFFSDAGNGDLFGYSLTADRNGAECIYRWDH